MSVAPVSAVTHARAFYAALRNALAEPTLAHQLRAAADGAVLGAWTQLTTLCATQACGALGWVAAAKGRAAAPLPVGRQEYLGIDVLAFRHGDDWRRPVAAIELENGASFQAVAYATWKVSVVSTELGVVLCYRREPAEIVRLVSRLAAEVLRAADPTG